MPYTLFASSADCYEGTTVLINKLDIHNQQELDRIETTLVLAKTVQWEEKPLSASFDFEHYKSIHRYLFEDLYDWAGKIRTVDISKKGTLFCRAYDIPQVSKAVFKRLADRNFFVGRSREEFAIELTDLYERTNELHPFREGNGRTQRVFLAQLAKNAGYRINFFDIEPDELMIATIQAANGSNDYLKELILKIVAKDQSGS